MDGDIDGWIDRQISGHGYREIERWGQMDGSRGKWMESQMDG